MINATSADELERTIKALDESRIEAETYREAWMKSERTVTTLRDQIAKMRHGNGTGNILWIADVARIGGVVTTTVESWIQRYEDFPKPRKGSRPREWDGNVDRIFAAVDSR